MKKFVVAVIAAVLLIGGAMAIQAQEQKAMEAQPFFDPGGGRT